MIFSNLASFSVFFSLEDATFDVAFRFGIFADFLDHSHAFKFPAPATIPVTGYVLI